MRKIKPYHNNKQTDTQTSDVRRKVRALYHKRLGGGFLGLPTPKHSTPRVVGLGNGLEKLEAVVEDVEK